MKLRKVQNKEKANICYLFHCPGCGHAHVMCTKHIDPNWPIWTFNGDIEKPTFKPSLLNHIPGMNKRCHLFITDGKIQYLNDCTHKLKGQTIEMVDLGTQTEK